MEELWAGASTLVRWSSHNDRCTVSTSKRGLVGPFSVTCRMGLLGVGWWGVWSFLTSLLIVEIERFFFILFYLSSPEFNLILDMWWKYNLELCKLFQTNELERLCGGGQGYEGITIFVHVSIQF